MFIDCRQIWWSHNKQATTLDTLKNETQDISSKFMLHREKTVASLMAGSIAVYLSTVKV